MRVPINAPTFRPLSPNEQKVYSLLRMGYKPKEVAKITKIPYGTELAVCFDPTLTTIKNIITSIREKGWDIPENENEEDEDMQKYTDKQKEKALKLFDEGMTPKEISIKLKLPYKSVWKWCDTYKKQKNFEQNIEEDSKATLADMEGHPAPTTETNPREMIISAEEHNEIHRFNDKKEEPASAATDTDSMVESFGKESTDIIPENLPTVKSRYFSDDTCEAVKDKLHLLYAELDDASNRMRRKYEAIDKINASIAEDDAICCSIQFRIQELEADCYVIERGVVGE